MMRLGVVVLLSTALWAPGFAQLPKPPLKPLDVFDLQWASDPRSEERRVGKEC